MANDEVLKVQGLWCKSTYLTINNRKIKGKYELSLSKPKVQDLNFDELLPFSLSHLLASDQEVLDRVYQIENGAFKGYFLKPAFGGVEFCSSPAQGYWMSRMFDNVIIGQTPRQFLSLPLKEAETLIAKSLVNQNIGYAMDCDIFSINEGDNFFRQYSLPKGIFNMTYTNSKGEEISFKDYAKRRLRKDELFKEVYPKKQNVLMKMLEDYIEENISEDEPNNN